MLMGPGCGRQTSLMTYWLLRLCRLKCLEPLKPCLYSIHWIVTPNVLRCNENNVPFHSVPFLTCIKHTHTLLKLCTPQVFTTYFFLFLPHFITFILVKLWDVFEWTTRNENMWNTPSFIRCVAVHVWLLLTDWVLMSNSKLSFSF